MFSSRILLNFTAVLRLRNSSLKIAESELGDNAGNCIFTNKLIVERNNYIYKTRLFRIPFHFLLRTIHRNRIITITVKCLLAASRRCIYYNLLYNSLNFPVTCSNSFKFVSVIVVQRIEKFRSKNPYFEHVDTFRIQKHGFRFFKYSSFEQIF